MNYPFYNNYLNPYMQQPVQNQDERIWVQGEDAARAYLVTANGFVRLWDSQAPVFYEKRADSVGRPYMDTFEYKRKGAETPQNTVLDNTGISELENRIKVLEGKIEALEGGKNE